MSTVPVAIPILSPNADMQAWFALVLQAARKIDAGATLGLIAGMATVTLPASAKAIQLTAIRQQDFARYGVQPDQLIQSELTGQPIVLSSAGAAQSRTDQVAALLSALTSNPDPAQKAKIQASIDQLQTFWAAQDEAAKPKPPALPSTPAESDAWRNLPIGTFVTIDGVNYVIGDAGGCGAMLCKRKSAPVAPPAPTVVTFKADCVAKVQATLATIDNEEAQAALLDFLKWLAAK